MYTTSRYASERTRRLARRMAAMAGEPYVSRGKHTMAELAETARRKGEGLISVIQEKDGEPSAIAQAEVSETGKWRWLLKKKID